MLEKTTSEITLKILETWGSQGGENEKTLSLDMMPQSMVEIQQNFGGT
jgi:hypothetical protein